MNVGNLTKSQKIVFYIGGGIILVILLMILGVLPGLKKSNPNNGGGTGSVNLEFWGIDSEDTFHDILSSYMAVNKSVQVTYKQINPDTYESDLINAMASQRGPDVLMIKHNWVPKHFEKLYPIPTASLSIKQFQDGFVDVAGQDLIYQGKIWGLPLWVDTLALYYNKDIFNSAAIALPPATWQEFQDISRQLTEKSVTGEIEKSGAALGTAKNIDNATDILSVLMLQAGTKITDVDGKAVFNSDQGQQALSFYTSFSNPASLYYSWNNVLPSSLDAFSQGKVAMIIDYASAREQLKDKNPYLNYGIAPLPQSAKNSSDVINYADYWALSVSALSSNQTAAWNFVFYLTGSQPAKSYLTKTNQAPAGRLLIKDLLNDEQIGVFAKQALSAKSWLQINPEKNSQVFQNMIESIVSGRLNINSALEQAVDEVNKTIND